MSAELFARVKDSVPDEVLADLAMGAVRLEEILKEETASDSELVQEACRLTLNAGGKRLRPMLALLAMLAINPNGDKEKAAKAGAALEMIHMATLIHDDVIDEADTRRGQPTASATIGSTASILAGDVLLSRAMRLLAEVGSIEIILAVSRSVAEMAEGEVQEVAVRGQFDLDEEGHLRILHLKTASFIEACCITGAILAGADSSQTACLARYGREIGLAFQIADDLLDYRGSSKKTGKSRATDFREGCATLPLIRLKSTLTEEELTFARGKFGNGVTDAEIEMICGWMEDRGAYNAAAEDAEACIERAMDALSGIPESPFRTFLSSVSSFVVTRES
jgi:octaprenyl-diphosphate synthase